MTDQVNLSSQQIVTIFDAIKAEEKGIIGLLLVAPDGLLVSDNLSAIDGVDKIAAMCAAIHALGKKLSAAISLGKHRLLTINHEEGFVFLLESKNYTLAVMAKESFEYSRLKIIATRIIHDIENT